MSRELAPPVKPRRPAYFRRMDPAVLMAFGCIVVLLLAGSLYSTSFLSPGYLLQQLQVGAFLAMVASGMMIVILLGQIDLSIPWLLSAGAMMSTAAVGWGSLGPYIAVPVGVLCGFGFGLLNGFGVAYLRVPSMIFTLGINAVAQGVMIVRTGGSAPQDMATPAMQAMATGHLIGPVPNVLWLWVLIGAATVFLLNRTAFGRAIYGIGNKEAAAYLSGISNQRIIMLAFGLSGALSGFAGVLLAGYSTKAYQGMGDAYLLPAIAAVVLGGTSIMGGRGSYLGTTAGVILVTLLQSILSVMQIPESGRQVIYGVVILSMLLLYGRSSRTAG